MVERALLVKVGFQIMYKSICGHTVCIYIKANSYEKLYTVFPHIIAAATILFRKLECGNYSKEETIQGRKPFFFVNFHNLNNIFPHIVSAETILF